MVVGAGRGPLVSASLKAADQTGRKIKVYAVEKNVNAIVTLAHASDAVMRRSPVTCSLLSAWKAWRRMSGVTGWRLCRAICASSIRPRKPTSSSASCSGRSETTNSLRSALTALKSSSNVRCPQDIKCMLPRYVTQLHVSYINSGRNQYSSPLHLLPRTDVVVETVERSAQLERIWEDSRGLTHPRS